MDAFAQHRTWQRARRLGLSQLACLGRHTLTGLLCAAGRQFIDWSADYRLFSKDAWEAPDLFVPVLRGVLAHVPPEAPVVVGVDDTHVEKTGTRTPGVAYRRDPLSPPFHVNFIRAQRFLQCAAMLAEDDPPGPARAIPIRYEHVPPAPKPRKSAGPEAQKAYKQLQRTMNLSTHAVRNLQDIRRELDQRHDANDRRLIAAVDGSYTNQTVLKGLPERTTLIGRVRKDAKLFGPPGPEDQPAVGAKRRYGDRVPTPDQVRHDLAIGWQEVTAFGAGKLHTFRVKTVGPVLWKKAGADHPLRLVVIAPVGYRPRKGSKLLYRQPAYLICTDPDLPLDQLLQYYLWRWDIEVNHRDEKQIIGVGEAQVRSGKSVGRQPALAVASYAMLLLAGTRALRTDRREGTLPPPKWQRKHSEQRLSTEELIRELRNEIWAEGLRQLDVNSDRFATRPSVATKPSELQFPVMSAMLYTSVG
ncbi:MAG: transposase [Planctomycetota bacterium]|jgi:hypothetical protein